jgi:hypothetical protein
MATTLNTRRIFVNMENGRAYPKPATHVHPRVELIGTETRPVTINVNLLRALKGEPTIVRETP